MHRYPTVAEVTDSARRLVSRFPGTCRLRRIGTSRGGRPIQMLSVGHGPRHVLVVARPHPDEPVGAATAMALAERMARGEGGASRATDLTTVATNLTTVTWNFVLCLDPDGAALSQGIEEATAGADHTLEGYYRAAYRPMAAEQPEWAPIVSRQLPESQALFDVIDELRPFLQCSLHSVEAGGTWVQLTRDLPELAAPFHTSAADNGIPVQHGTFDALYWENPAPGIFILPPPDLTDRLAAGSENIALSTWCAPPRYGGTTAIIEVPLWTTDMADDPTPHPDPTAALRALSALVLDGGRQVTAILDKARAFLPEPQDSPRGRVLEWMADGLYDLVAESWQPLATDASHPLTTAQICALDIVARRQPLRAAGLLHHLLNTTPAPTPPTLHHDVNELLTTWSTDFKSSLRLSRVPIHHQVGHQSRTVLTAAGAALNVVTA
ncbi:M14 family zinc carboxypeptidase [Streptomyces sp. NPDC091292]|uniref:M14 family zinc carboxypeptidase n=1 Tax=Streptomyces sp. NPDC091292 TaxID=3365991 RepID=UPI00382C28CD